MKRLRDNWGLVFVGTILSGLIIWTAVQSLGQTSESLDRPFYDDAEDDVHIIIDGERLFDEHDNTFNPDFSGDDNTYYDDRTYYDDFDYDDDIYNDD